MENRSIKILYLCITTQAQNTVLKALQGHEEFSFDLVTVDTLSDFQKQARQGGFKVGLVDFPALPKKITEYSRILEKLGKMFPLVLLVTKSKEEKALHLISTGFIKDYLVLSRGEERKLPFALRSAALWGCGVARQNWDLPRLNLADESISSGQDGFFRLIQNSMVGLARTTPDGHIISANTGLIQMLGFDSLEELQIRNLQQEGFTPDHPRYEFSKLVEAKDELYGYETTWVRKDGTLVHVRESSRAVRGEDNKTLYYESIVENITEQKQASASLKEKIAVLQALMELDRDILTARQSGDILEVVCHSAASLLMTPMAIIISVHETKWQVDATFGIKFPEKMAEELSETFPGDVEIKLANFSINEVSASPSMMPNTIALEGVRSMMAETVLVGTVNQGILFVLDSVPRTWTQNDKELLKTLAGQASIALEKVRLLTEAERRADEFSALHEVSSGLAGERDLRSILSLIVDSVSQILEVPNAFIYLFNEKDKTLLAT